jgi:ketosteroid isomerase-like protein
MGAREDAHFGLIEKLYEATGKGDWDTAAGYLTEDFFVTEADTMPFAGVYRGRGALQELYVKVMGMMDVVDLSITETTVRGDYAVTLLDMVLAGDPPVRVPLAEMFRFRDGKVCEIKPYYFDPTPITRAVQQRLQSQT